MIQLLYVAVGAAYLDECKESIATFRKWNKTFVTVVTSPELVRAAESFADAALPATGQGYLAKVNAITNFGTERFWFVDTDAFCVRALDRIAALSSRYGIMAARDPLGDTMKHVALKRPASWPPYASLLERELNTGVIVINKSNLSPEFMTRWKKRHQELMSSNPEVENSKVQDQPSFHISAEDLSVPVGILPSELNLRGCYPNTVVEAPYIIHSRQPHWRAVAEALEKVDDVTTFYPFGVLLGRRGILNRGSFAVRRFLERRLYKI